MLLRKIVLFTFISLVFFTVLTPVQAQVPTASPVVGGKLTNGCGIPGGVCCDLHVDDGTISGSSTIVGAFFSSALNWMSGGIKTLIFGKTDYNQCYITAPVTTNGVCTCAGITEVNSYDKVSAICNKFFKVSDPNDAQALADCNECAQNNKFYTGIGCVPLTMSSFLGYIFIGPLVGFSGITALLVIIYSAFTLQISRGNPDKIKVARERLTAAIVGLFVILSAMFLLRFIGVDLLQLPGFGK